MSPPLCTAIGTPPSNSSRLPGRRGTLSPGVRMPARFSGSTAEIATRSRPGVLRGLAQGRGGFGQRELLAGEAADEAAAAHLAARFEPAQHVVQLAPGRQPFLAFQQLAENHAPAAQQHARDVLDVRRRQRARHVGRRPGPARERPAAGVVHRVVAPRLRRSLLRLSSGITSVRRPANESQVTRPCATSSASACSTCVPSSRASCCRSAKKLAPCVRSTSSTWRAAPDSTASSTTAAPAACCQWGRASRSHSSTGVPRIGPVLRPAASPAFGRAATTPRGPRRKACPAWAACSR